MLPEQDHDHEVIVPQYKLIVTYDVLPSNQENYFQFIMGELLPAMQEMGVYMTEAWHTAYGDYPLRMATFVAEDYDTIVEMLDSDRWQELERRFKIYIRNYSLVILPYRHGFQFVRSEAHN